MTARLIDGKKIAEAVRGEVAQGVRDLASRGVVPGLTVVLVGDDPASAIYVGAKDKAAREAGIRSETLRLPAGTSETELLSVVHRLNADARVHGILVQLPLPPQIREEAILHAIDPRKDVDGFHPINQGLLLQGKPRFVPATALAVSELLHRDGTSVAGKRVVVVGRSNIVGRPLAALLLAKGERGDATVTVCHSKTPDLARVAREGDVLVAAIGSPRFVKPDMVGPGAVVVDVGINRVEGRVTGDVDFEAVRHVASAITPVPGGVGPMTIAMLLANTLRAAQF